MTAIFLDPPYVHKGRDVAVYDHDDAGIAHEVARWAIENGDNPLLRICYAGYDDGYGFPDTWERVLWKPKGGYGNQRKNGINNNRERETLFFSPHCLKPNAQLKLWEDMG